MRILRTSAALTATALLALGFTAGPASAATTVQSAPHLQAANSTSTTFAGYAVGGAGGAAVTSASTAFTVPSVTCPATGNTGVIAAALIGSTTTANILAAGGVFIVCQSGTLIYQNFLDVNNHAPTSFTFTPVAHDSITVSVSQTATAAKVVLTDVTQNKTQTYKGKKGSAGGTDDASNIGDNTAVSGTVGNPPFGTIIYSANLTNGVAIATLPHTGVNEATALTGGTLQILTSKLNASANTFKTTFKHT